jgi:hypothetical protein
VLRGHVPDLVADDAGQLVLVVGQREEPARDVDVAAGQREGVRLLHVDDLEAVRQITPGRDGGEPLAHRANVGHQGRIVVQAHLGGDLPATPPRRARARGPRRRG